MKLNDKQELAVKSIEGAVMVLAGPGTGKTQILSTRIGEIMSATDTQPFNILCLTFTDAGVVAMKKRLVSMYGANAHKIHVYTFHGFSNKVISENPHVIGIKDMEPASNIDVMSIIREIIDGLEKDHILRRVSNNPYFDEDALKELFQTLKMEGISISQLAKKVIEYLGDLPNREEYVYKRKYKQFNAGDIKESAVAEETKRMDKLLQASVLVNEYNKKLKARRLYDYSDMLLFVKEAWQKHEFLLRRYQEQYLYLLIDEFQDTNGVQFDLINQLISYWGTEANVFTVGDDDQTLYEFAGSRIENLNKFANQFPDIKQITLDTNYRSNQWIVDAATKVIRNNTERIDHNKYFDTATKVKNNSVRLLEFETQEEELAYALTLAENTEDLAIIYSKHNQVEGLIRALDGKGIPYTTKRRLDVLYHPIVNAIVKIATFFTDTYKYDPLLYEILHYPFIPIGRQDANTVFNEKRLWNAKNPEQPKKVLDFVTEDSKLGIILSELIQLKDSMHPFIFIREFINRLYILPYFIRDENALSVIKTFIDFTEDIQKKNMGIDLAELLKTIQSMKENKLTVPVVEIINQGGVQLMTAHGSKGLEFKNVLMLDCTSKWEPSKGGHYKFKFPDTITLSGEQGSIESSRRAFYVAMTRAEENLFITYSNTHQDKPVNRALFVDELEMEPEKTTIPYDDIIDYVSSNLKATIPIQTQINNSYIAEILDGFILSFSAMSQYQKCPVGFYYQYVLKVPIIEKQHLTYGSAMHYAMEQFYRDMRKDNKTFPSFKVALEYFEQYMRDNEFRFGKLDYKRYYDRGTENLNAYLKQATLNKFSRVEQYISDCEIEGVPVKGIIDKMEFESDIMVKLVDYKTGKFDKSKYVKGDLDNIGGEHWRQAMFYVALVFAQNKENWVPSQVVFEYLEPDNYGKFQTAEIATNKESLGLIRNQVKNVYQSIMKQDFSNGCGEETCQWCNLQTIIKL